ncbi:MAG TPA: hypothetical protein DIT07_09485 [Sphingobacteriaceae bacterium]|nr:hypothetical protein [Sphingobacteriaceae bacterium]
MKKAKITWVLFLITFITINLSGTSVLMAQPGVSISFQTFHDELAPYGRWVDDRDDGRIWIPDVEQDFRPYATRGHWIVTDYGNTWVSDYDWGWAPFHYGRWRMHDRYGWVWVPGDEWGPAWVSWRSGGGYYGWAPLGPRVGISININLPNLWVFVPQRHLCDPYVYNYYERSPRVVNIYNNTTIINNIYKNNNHSYVYGPDRRDIERATQSRVQVYKVNDSGRPGSATVRNGSVNIYRPDVNRDQQSGSSRYDDRGKYDNSRDTRNNDRGNGSNDNRSRPGYSSSGNAASSEDRVTSENSRAGNANSAPRRPEPVDHTPAIEKKAPYEDRNSQRSADMNRGQAVPQRSEERQVEQPSRREAPQPAQERRAEQSSGRQAPQQQSSGRSSRQERTQSATQQSSEKQSDNNSRKERPSRVR